jgi:hypothetical protein
MVFARACGPLTVNEIKTTIEKFGNDLEFNPQYRVIVDISEAVYAPSIADVRDVVATIVEFRQTFDRRIALVVPNVVVYHMTKLTTAYAAINTNLHIAPFYSFEDAVDWIDTPNDHVLSAGAESQN